MIPQGILKAIGCDEKKLKEYFMKCDEVFEVPGGYAVLRGDIAHIFAPQTSLSGRKLILACKVCLDKMHRRVNSVYAPVKKENEKAKLFVEKLGFEKSKIDDTHVWFVHRGNNAHK